MIEFVYTGGKYREFRGYVFANGKPVVIKDAATVAALERDSTFKRFRDEERQEATTPAKVLTQSPAKTKGFFKKNRLEVI